MPAPNRTYSEKEIAALLERTAQLQAEQAEDVDRHREGLSLSELEAIASDAGLDPQFLHRAALELEHASGKPLGKNKTNTHIRVDRVLPSDLSDEEWEDIIFVLRRRFDTESLDLSGLGTYGRGKVEQIGRSREWRHSSLSGVQTSVLFRPHPDGTRLEISQLVGFGGPKATAWGIGSPFALIFATIMGAIAKSLLIGATALVGWLVVLVPLIYYADTRWREKKHNQLVELANELQGIVMRDSSEEDPIPGQASEDSGTRSIEAETDRQGRVDVPDEWNAPESTSDGGQPQRGRTKST